MQEDGQANITKLTTEAELVEERTELSRYRAGNRADLLYYSSPQRLS